MDRALSMRRPRSSSISRQSPTGGCLRRHVRRRRGFKQADQVDTRARAIAAAPTRMCIGISGSIRRVGSSFTGRQDLARSHLARAVANEVDARFYYINGPDVIGTYTGETEANLRRMFNEAGHHAPSIIFIDELDAMAPKRGETGAHADTRTVTQLLALMDGLKRVDSVIVIGTTNRIDAIDPAFRRPGRFDREIFIGPPDVPGRREILEIHSREMPLSDDAQAFLDEVARRTHGFLGADLMELCRDAGLSRLRRSAGNLQDHRAAFRIPLRGLAGGTRGLRDGTVANSALGDARDVDQHSRRLMERHRRTGRRSRSACRRWSSCRCAIHRC